MKLTINEILLKEIEDSIEEGTFHKGGEMPLEEALEKIQYLDKEKTIAMVRQCCECGVTLDEQSEVIKNRSKIEWVLTHSYCPECAEKINEEIDNF